MEFSFVELVNKPHPWGRTMYKEGRIQMEVLSAPLWSRFHYLRPEYSCNNVKQIQHMVARTLTLQHLYLANVFQSFFLVNSGVSQSSFNTQTPLIPQDSNSFINNERCGLREGLKKTKKIVEFSTKRLTTPLVENKFCMIWDLWQLSDGCSKKLLSLSHPLDHDLSWKGSPSPKYWKKISGS